MTRSWRVGERERVYTARRESGGQGQFGAHKLHGTQTHTPGSILHSRVPLLAAFVDEMAEFLLTAGVIFSFNHMKGFNRPVDGGQ